MWGLRSNSISNRLTVMNMLVSAAALILACAGFFAYDALTFRENLARQTSVQAQMVGANAISALAFDDPQSAQSTLSVLHYSPHVTYAAIYTPSGQLFASYSRDKQTQQTAPPAIPEGNEEFHAFRENRFVLARSIVFEGRRLGTVYIRTDIGDLTRRLQRYLFILLTIMLSSLVAALAVSRVFQQSIATPLIDLATVAQSVSREKNYQIRALESRNLDEVSSLVKSFNEMLGQIQERDRALQQAHDELEARVQRRTAELENRTNQMIEQARLLDMANDAILVRDVNEKIRYWNAGAQRLYGWSEEEAVGNSPSELLGTEFPVAFSEIASSDLWEGELRQKKRDGSRIVVASRWTTIRDREGNPTAWLEINTDITSRKRAEASAQRLTGRLLTLQDDERRRIARELHDSFGQYLTALKMYVDRIATVTVNPEVSRMAAESSKILQQSIGEIRTISHLLHPPLLDEAGFTSAARWYADGFAQRSGIQVELELSPELRRMPTDVETALFRVLQEGLTNVHRHSGSAKVDIVVLLEAECVMLRITDYGRGISGDRLRSLRAAESEMGVGLAGMRERVRELGGKFEIDSNGSGTTISVSIPVIAASEGMAAS